MLGFENPKVSFLQPLPCPANAGFFSFRGESLFCGEIAP